MSNTPITAAVFAGGGSRCVWQVGFWETVAPALNFRPHVVAAVSAGAAMACIIFAGRTQQALRLFSGRMANNRKNFYPSHLLRPSRSAFPQEQIYRECLLDVLDNEAFSRLQREAPPIHVLLSRPPRWGGPRTSALVGLVTYKLEKKIKRPVHPRWGRRIGFTPEVVSSRDCQTRQELVELILQSSCTPPFTPLYKRQGRAVLDGGLIDNVPVAALPYDANHDCTLVLLSRPYPTALLQGHARRVYVQPSRPAAVSTWDYTSPLGLSETHDIGRRDGEAFLNSALSRRLRNNESVVDLVGAVAAPN